MLPNWTIAVTERVMAEIVPAQANLGLPVSSLTEAMYNKAPDRHVGKMRKMIGVVPSMI